MDLPRLIVLDLDGTLLPESKQISSRSLRVLSQLQDRGAKVTLATGKFLHLSRTYGEQLQIEAPLVALDGARISRRGHLSERGIERRIAIEALEEIIDPRWDAFGDNGADEFLLRSERPLLRRIARIWADRVREVDDLASHLVSDPGILVAYGPIDELEDCAAVLRDRFPTLRVSAMQAPQMGGSRLAIQPPDTNKGSGVRTVLEDSGIDARECMVFGDWHNDISMFEIGCVNVAMANAVDEVTALATGDVRSAYERLGLEMRGLTVLRPAVDPGSVGLRDEGNGEGIRWRRWAADRDTFVVGLLSEPPGWGDAQAAMIAVSLVDLTGRRVKLVVHPAARGRLEVRGWARKLDLERHLVVDEALAEPWRVVRGLDAVLLGFGASRDGAVRRCEPALPGDGCRRPVSGVLPLLWAMAAGVPVIVEEAGPGRGIIQDGHNGLLVDAHDNNGVAVHIMRLYDDRAAAARLGDAARKHVETRFRIDDYCRRLGEVYEEVATKGRRD